MWMTTAAPFPWTAATRSGANSRHLIDRFAAFNLIERRGDRLRFPDEGARRYVNGGWLEDHVSTHLEQIRAESSTIQDMARGLEYIRLNDAAAIKNELDVAFLAGNRLHIIECKTKRFQCTLNPDAPGADALYKLDGVRQQLGGRQARVLFVSYQPLLDSHRQRAADMGIRLCVGREIHYIAELLREWVPAGRGRAWVRLQESAVQVGDGLS